MRYEALKRKTITQNKICNSVNVLNNVQIDPEAHPASHETVTGADFPGGKATSI
jgi:hypothetical protein